ncbi:hypothetical protein [Streptomyces sp. NPDC059063]|uniref:hypothetical protein n=1 Tax=unclassified Streptomyces TaxID=2593676 RepID=UPI0036A602A0
MTPAQLLDKQELIKHLRNLAGKPQLGPRAVELDTLAHDLTHDTRLDRWAELDLVHAYVRPESVTTGGGRPSARRDGLLEAALGALVFVPLLVTWFGLREAVLAYGELSKADKEEATRPFLQLWQSGFDGHLSPLGRFENVALMAVVLIALLVLLSVVHARVRARADREEAEQEAERELLLAELAGVLTRLQMLLAPRRSASPAQFTSELTKAAGELRHLAGEAERNHKALVTATGAVTGATTSLQDAAVRLTAEIPKLSTAADRIRVTLRAGQVAAAKTETANADAARLIADQVKAAGSTVESSLKSLLTAQKELVAKTAAVALATEQASKALVSSTGRTNDAVDGMREATERWDAAAAHWQDAAARVDSGVRSLAAPLRNGAVAAGGQGADLFGAGGRGADPYGTNGHTSDPHGATGHTSDPHGANGHGSEPYGATVPAANPFEVSWSETNRPGTDASRPPGTDVSGAPAPPAPDVNGGPVTTPRTGDTHPQSDDGPDLTPPPADTADAPVDTDLRSDRTRALRPPAKRPPTPPRRGSDT